MRASMAEIQAYVQQVSIQLNHYYLGVEHLFLGLLRLPDSLSAQILRVHRQSPPLVEFALIESLGKSLERRYWEDFRSSPRYEFVISLAENYRATLPDELALLRAIIEEGDNIPTRLLSSLRLSFEGLLASIQNWEHLPSSSTPLEIDSHLALGVTQQRLLQQLFDGADQLYVGGEFIDIPGQERLYLLEVALPENGQRAPILVKFDHPAQIVREKWFYDRTVRGYLENVPHAFKLADLTIDEANRLGALVYFPPAANSGPIRPLADLIEEKELPDLLNLLNKQLWEGYYANWWGGRERYRYGLWREYEACLPPALTLKAEAVHVDTVLRPLGDWSYLGEYRPGVRVELQDFTVERLWPSFEEMSLIAGMGEEAVNRASRVGVEGVTVERMARYAVGQSIGILRGIVVATRETMLLETAKALGFEPYFTSDKLMLETPLGTLPNPIYLLPRVLTTEVESYFSLMHGALHLGNIFVEGQGRIVLNDYTQFRFGSTLGDWAQFEASLVGGVVAPLAGTNWEALWAIAMPLQALNQQRQLVIEEAAIKPVGLLGYVRGLAENLLSKPQDWREYFAAMLCYGLRDAYENKLDLGGRRLAFILAALAAEAFSAYDDAFITLAGRGEGED